MAKKKASHDHHGPSLGGIFGIFAILILCTGLTVVVAYQDLGRFSAFVAFSIAAFKATLVVLYFMHVRYSSRLIALYAASGFVFLAIMLGITMGEVAGRSEQGGVDPLRPTAPPAPAVPPPQRPADDDPP